MPAKAAPRTSRAKPTPAATARPTGVVKKRLPPRLSGIFNEIITAVIKTEAQTWKFPIYKKAACYYSSKIREFCKENPTASTVPVLLSSPSPLRNPALFDYFVQYITIQRFEYSTSNHTKRSGTTGTNTPCSDIYEPLIRLYQLAEEMGTTPLQNSVMNQILLLFNASCRTNAMKLISVSTINYIYKSTNRGSLLRKLAVDMWAFYGNKEELFGTTREVPVNPAFTVDFGKRMVDLREMQLKVAPPVESYHLEEISEDESDENNEDDLVILEKPPEPAASQKNAERQPYVESADESSDDGLFVRPRA